MVMTKQEALAVICSGRHVSHDDRHIRLALLLNGYFLGHRQVLSEPGLPASTQAQFSFG